MYIDNVRIRDETPLAIKDILCFFTHEFFIPYGESILYFNLLI